MEMVLKIKNLHIEDVDLSNTLINPGTLLRINFSDLKKYEKYFYDKSMFNFNKEITHLHYWGNKISKRNIFSTYSSRELFKDHLGYNNQEISEFGELMYPNFKDKGLNSPVNEKIKSLPFGDRMVIYCKLFTEKSDSSSSFVIGTAGMHMNNLKLTYQLLSTYLSGGGSCIEMTYPPMKDSQMDEIFNNKLKIIQIE